MFNIWANIAVAGSSPSHLHFCLHSHRTSLHSASSRLRTFLDYLTRSMNKQNCLSISMGMHQSKYHHFNTLITQEQIMVIPVQAGPAHLWTWKTSLLRLSYVWYLPVTSNPYTLFIRDIHSRQSSRRFMFPRTRSLMSPMPQSVTCEEERNSVPIELQASLVPHVPYHHLQLAGLCISKSGVH